MELLLYVKKDNESGENLLDAVGKVVGRDRIEWFDNLEAFERRLHQPWDNWKIAIILAESELELKSVLEIRHVLLDLRLILILPDRNKEIVSAGHLLRPRFLSFADAWFEDLKSILPRMLEAGN